MQKQAMLKYATIIILIILIFIYCLDKNKDAINFIPNSSHQLTFANSIINFQSQPPPPPSATATSSFCTIYKNETIRQNIKNLSFIEKTFLNLSNKTKLQIFHYGEKDYVSRYLIKDHHWEKLIVSPFMKLLSQDDSLQFIDIGSNLGVYSLAAASLGRKVVAVEAMEETCQRNYASILLNGFENQIVLVQNALSDFRGNITIKIDLENIGASFVVNNRNSKVNHKFTTMQSIYMDDLLEVITFNRSIMKMDIEGSEARALSHAKLLFSRIDIPVVLFEWAHQGEWSEDTIYYFLSKGYRPFSSLYAKKPDLKLSEYKKWPFDMVWKKEPYLFVYN